MENGNGQPKKCYAWKGIYFDARTRLGNGRSHFPILVLASAEHWRETRFSTRSNSKPSLLCADQQKVCLWSKVWLGPAKAPSSAPPARFGWNKDSRLSV